MPTTELRIYNALVGAVDDVIAPVHRLLALNRTLASLENHLREVGQRVLNQITHRILQHNKRYKVLHRLILRQSKLMHSAEARLIAKF